MKILLFSFLLILSGCMTYEYAYNTTSKPQVGDNTIIIKTNNTDQDNYKNFGKYLIDKGYSFETKDAEFLTCMTRPKYHKSGSEAGHRFVINYKDKIIYIKPEFNTLSFSAHMSGEYRVIWIEWHYKNDIGNIHLKAFQHFFPVIQEYSKDIEFLTR